MLELHDWNFCCCYCKDVVETAMLLQFLGQCLNNFNTVQILSHVMKQNFKSYSEIDFKDCKYLFNKINNIEAMEQLYWLSNSKNTTRKYCKIIVYLPTQLT